MKISGFLSILCFLYPFFSFQHSALGEGSHENLINCKLEKGPCTASFSGYDILFDIQPKPVKAMSALLFRITVPDKLSRMVKNFQMSLDMPGMNMGINRVNMRPVSRGVYEGKGVIVRCPSGGKVWRASADLPETGPIQFIFKVEWFRSGNSLFFNSIRVPMASG